MGRAIAAAFAAAGDEVVVADLDGAAAEDCAAALGGRAVQLDVTDVDAVRTTLAANDRESPFRTVVASAGIAVRKPLLDMEPDEYDRLMGVNVRGVFFVVQAALRAMAPRRTGSIVTVSSTSGFQASTGPMTAYDASKGAVRILTQSAAREAAAFGVRVNAVAPGTVVTDLTRALATDEQLAQLGRERVPLGRLGEPEEIAQAVVFLASDAASYVTGHVLVADGGWLA